MEYARNTKSTKILKNSSNRKQEIFISSKGEYYSSKINDKKLNNCTMKKG